MLGYVHGCCLAVMYSRGRKMWEKPVGRVNDEEFLYDLFLTETFCGFIHTGCTTNINVVSQRREGSFELTLYETHSGLQIMTRGFWNFDFPYNLHSGIDWKRVQPKLAADGRYLFACCTHGRCERNPKGDQENTFLVAKSDFGRRAWRLHRTNTGLETVLLAKALMDQSDLLDTPAERSSDDADHIVPRVVFDYRTFDFLGFAFESVAIIQVEYLCVTNNFRKCGKVIMSVDLDKILNMDEPANVFSAVHFPIGKNMFEEFKQVGPQQAKSTKFGDIHSMTEDKVEYFPFYRTLPDEDGVDEDWEEGDDVEDKVELDGFVEISDHQSESALRPKIHSFRVELEEILP